jgi:uncharacterized protein YecE (DUF72 family)
MALSQCHKESGTLMEFYVGTSGWMYSWNLKGTLDWYLENSGLNSVELNASFYRFPFPTQVNSWATKGGKLRWTIKVNRLITHQFKFSERGFASWQKFAELFKPLDAGIDFYLFQLPPQTKPSMTAKLEEFVRKTGLGERFALEVRNMEWFKEEWIKWATRLGITWVSIDSPDFPLDVFNTSGIVYERIHGRSSWYSHNYSDKELSEIRLKILEAAPKKVYVYFNNDTNMLRNAKRMFRLLTQK